MLKDTVGGPVAFLAGGVCGEQAEPCAELTAALWVAKGSAATTTIASSFACRRAGVEAMFAPGVRWSHAPTRVVWRLAAPRGVSAATGAVRSGISWRAWWSLFCRRPLRQPLGNRRRQCALVRVPLALRAEGAGDLDALRRTRSVFATVKVAGLLAVRRGEARHRLPGHGGKKADNGARAPTPITKSGHRGLLGHERRLPLSASTAAFPVKR